MKTRECKVEDGGWRTRSVNKGNAYQKWRKGFLVKNALNTRLVRRHWARGVLAWTLLNAILVTAVPVMASVDLAIAITASPVPVEVYGELTYTIEVAGPRLGSATGVTVVDSVPNGTEFVAAGVSQGIWSYDRGRVVARLGYLEPGVRATVTIGVRPTALGDVVNSATVAADQPDGNPENNIATITTSVVDTTAPTITCPPDIVTSGAPGSCSQRVTFPAPSATDKYDLNPTVSCDPPSGSNFPKGVTPVFCRAVDASGNTSTCSFTVTIRDTEAPQINRPANIVLSPDPGRQFRSNVTWTVSATDNCDRTVPVTCSPPSGSTFPVGVTTVTCSAIDSSGNRGSLSFNVTIWPLHDFVASFTGTGLDPALDDPANTYQFSNGEAVNTGARNYLRTVATDFNTVDFVAETVYTMDGGNWGAGLFFGLGAAELDPNYSNEPLHSVYALDCAQDFCQGTFVRSLPISGNPILFFSWADPATLTDGTNALRLIKQGDRLTFQMDFRYDPKIGFAPTYSGHLALSDVPFLDASNSRLFVGTGPGPVRTRIREFRVRTLNELDASGSFRITDFAMTASGLLSLQWPDLGSAYGYLIEYRSTLGTNAWATVPPVQQWPLRAANWTGAVPTNYNNIFLRVRAQLSADPAAAPTVSAAAMDKDNLELRWQPVVDASSYNIYWHPEPNMSLTLLRNISNTSTRISLTTQSEGEYFVTAVTPRGEGPPSETIRVGAMPFLARILEAGASQKQYSFKLEHSAGLRYEGQVDLAEDREYVTIVRPADPSVTIEMLSRGTNGFARSDRHMSWLPVEPQHYASYLAGTLDYLANAPLVALREDGDDWLVGIRSGPSTNMEDLVSFWKPFVEQQSAADPEHVLAKLIELTEHSEALWEFRISRSTHHVSSLTFNIVVENVVSKVNVTFGPKVTDLPPNLEGVTDVPPLNNPELLLFYVASVGGWSPRNHCSWAQESLSIIKAKDASKIYSELYSDNWYNAAYDSNTGHGIPQPFVHHPIILGSYYEDTYQVMPQYYDDWFKSDEKYNANPDYYWPHAPYPREYNHFGNGRGQGLTYQPWFDKYYWNPTPPRPMPQDRFYDARDWAYGPPRTLAPQQVNGLSFTEAVQQYNRYTSEGNTNAYLMMGHVTHLLQDLAQPDHARGVFHIHSRFKGSDNVEGSTVRSIKDVACSQWGECARSIADPACRLLNFVPFCFGCSTACRWTAYFIAKAVCANDWCDSCRGYERVVEDDWQFASVASLISDQGILKQPDFDSYFADMAKYSSSLATFAQLKSPLGCSDFTTSCGVMIPGWVPNIGDTPQAKRAYLELTDKLVSHCVGSVAGLLEHFYEIVNHPPFLERVKIVQWENGATTPRKFGSLGDDPIHCGGSVTYDAEWQTDPKTKTRLLIHNQVPQKVHSDIWQYVFVLFGPYGLAPEPGGLLMDQVRLSLTGIDNATGQSFNIPVELQPAKDDHYGNYYWGRFQMKNCGLDPNIMTMNFQAKDNRAHLQGRNPLGNELDAYPETLAIVQPSLQPYYPWSGYEPGIDTHHRLWIQPAELQVSIDTALITLATNDVNATAESHMIINQRAWSCSAPDHNYWGPTSCEVQWTLDPMMKKTSVPTSVKIPADFGLNVELITDLRGAASLVVRRALPPAPPPMHGKYEITINYAYPVNVNGVNMRISLEVQ